MTLALWRYCAVGLLAAPLCALAATPDKGTLSPTSGPLTFTSGPFTSANATPVPLVDTGPTCDDPTPACDHYELTISLPAGYVAAHNQDSVKVTTSWEDTGSGSSDYDLYIYKGLVNATDGGDTPPYKAASQANPEVTTIYPLLDGDNLYTIKIVPYTPSGEVVTTTIELVNADGVATNPNFGKADPVVANAPRYLNYTPHPINAEDGFGECNIGFNPKTFKIMFMCFGDGSVYRLTTPERLAEPLPEACPANWEEVTPLGTSGPQPVADPILFTDAVSGRTWASNLTVGPNVSYSYTDNDGDSWIDAGGGAVVGADHQTIGSGPYPASFTGPHPFHQNAVYFCSQDIVGPAGCARSDDGGATYAFTNPLAYDGTMCRGLHGHVRVAPNGTVWLPVEVCGDGTGYAISKDAAVTWNDFQIPGSASSAGSDPSIALDAANRAYFCFVDGDGHIKAVTSDDEGTTWRDTVDLGAEHGLKNGAFPEAWASDNGRAACAFYGTDRAGNMESLDFPGLWYAFVAHTYDAGKTWDTTIITPNDPIQGLGGIWQSGGGNSNRNLLDFNEVTMDDKGRLIFGYDDGCVRDCAKAPLDNPQSFTALMTMARQSGGKRLVAAHDTPEPHAPANACLSGARDQFKATLKWVEPDSGGAPITNYRVYRSTAPTGPLAFLGNAGPKNGYVDRSVDPNVEKYYYTVKAVNDSGISVDSNKIELAVVPQVIEKLCVIPGLTFFSDATGDFDTALAPEAGRPFHDLLLLKVAQPPVTDGVTKLVFTLKVASLAAPLPLNVDWWVSFRAPDGKLRGVRMSTDRGSPRFFSYEVGASSGGITDGRFKAAEGPIEADSNFTQDGIITFVVKAINVGGTGAAGEVYTEFNAGTVQKYGGPAGPSAGDAMDGMPDGLARAGRLTLEPNGSCVTQIGGEPAPAPAQGLGNNNLGGALSGLGLLALGLIGGLRRRRR